jgi:hypothetical protein
MNHWNTETIKKMLSDPRWEISTILPGGDYDTTNLILRPNNSKEQLFICGFNTNNVMANPNNCEIEMVEVKDGCDSGGGLKSSDLNLALAYAEVCVRLRKSGFDVVPNMDNYF